MPFKTSISSSLDTNRIASAVSRPGIDTRVTSTLAVVDGFAIDDKQGIFVNVTCMPLGNDATVRMGAAYAGNGFGFYAPLHVDDEVLVVFPHGEYDEGGVIVARMWSASDPPPSEAKDNPADVILHVEDNNAVRILANGASIVIDSDGNVTAQSKDGASAALNGKDATVSAASPDGVATVTATAVTGAVKLGPVGSLQVLVFGSMDSMGVPVTQAPAAVNSIVKAG